MPAFAGMTKRRMNMQKQITPFYFEEKQVRVLIDDTGEPWWVAKDVCEVLEYADQTQALERLDEDEKGVVKIPTPGGPQSMITISESGLYNLIFRSLKPEARSFRRWITHEILPSIRKTGQFSLNNEPLLEFSENDGLSFAQRIRIMELALRVLEKGIKVSDFADAQRLIYRTATAKPFNADRTDSRDDHFEDFISRECAFESDAETTTDDIYSAYFKDANAFGVRPYIRNMFFRKLYEAKDVRKFYSRRTGEDRKYMIKGVGLIR